MPKCTIDGKEIEFSAGQNLIEVAKSGGIDIPFFCYHPGLSVVAQCRMCAVEIEKMPKLQTACSTAATEGMIVRTKAPRVIQAQEATMEFLLMNHPLDCPVCDKSGECDLQDNSYGFGEPFSRSTEERRSYIDVDMGPVIQKNMNRCIHCTRCIRFGEEIAGIREMVALRRGNDTEITTVDGLPLETEYAGNYADICPTGSLTVKDFRFKKRVWFLKKTATVCEGCSRGCNMEIHQDGNTIYRCVPKENQKINKYWLCDEGRFNFRYVQAEDRVDSPLSFEGGKATQLDWDAGIDRLKAALKGKKLLFLVGSDLTQEEAQAIVKFKAASYPDAQIAHFGTPGIHTAGQDAPADRILKRTSKTANLHGIEKLGLKGFEKLESGTQLALVFRGGRAVVPSLKGVAQIGIGVFNQALAAEFSFVLPGLAFAEKDGSVFNFEGVEQKFSKAVKAPFQCKPVSEILMMLAHQKINASGAA